MSAAVTKLKTKAEYLAKPLGQKVGKAIYISEMFQPANNYALLLGRATGISEKTRQEEVLPDVDIQKIRIATEVSIKFILE